MYRFGIYFVSFLIGYYIFSHDGVQDAIENICIPMLCLSIAGAVFYAIYYEGQDYTSAACLQNILTNLYLWIVVLAVLGCGKRYLNCETNFSKYMTKSSFGVYILHYPVLMVICYVLYSYFDLPAVWNYAIALVLEIAVTVIVYEIIRRLPVVRYLVLGITPIRNSSAHIR